MRRMRSADYGRANRRRGGGNVATYEKVLKKLEDGGWHSRRELDEVTVFPEEWIKELLREGHEVLEDGQGRLKLRLREPAAT
jgi:hypothetical protein